MTPQKPLARATLKMWQTAAYLTDRTRRAIRERRLTGDTVDSLAADYEVPCEFVEYLCSWQMFGDPPQPERPR